MHNHHLDDAVKINASNWKLFLAFLKDMRVIMRRWRIINRLKKGKK